MQSGSGCACRGSGSRLGGGYLASCFCLLIQLSVAMDSLWMHSRTATANSMLVGAVPFSAAIPAVVATAKRQ